MPLLLLLLPAFVLIAFALLSLTFRSVRRCRAFHLMLFFCGSVNIYNLPTHPLVHLPTGRQLPRPEVGEYKVNMAKDLALLLLRSS